MDSLHHQNAKGLECVTPNNLPALICGTVYYKTSKKIRYQCCTEHGIIKGTFGREQLDPLPHMDAKVIRVDYAPLDKKNHIALTKAGEMYTPVSGRSSFCRCQKNDCRKSKSCNCSKFCTNFCHSGSGKYPLCKNCPPGEQQPHQYHERHEKNRILHNILNGTWFIISGELFDCRTV
jgi:hypothetical protein